MASAAQTICPPPSPCQAPPEQATATTAPDVLPTPPVNLRPKHDHEPHPFNPYPAIPDPQVPPSNPKPEIHNPKSPLHAILEAARWAPSGDNTQPWRFEIVNDRRIIIHGRDTRDHCVYDLTGAASQIALGALIETLVIAATTQSLAAHVTRRPGLPNTQPTFDVALSPWAKGEGAAPAADPLASWIEKRVTQRRPMRTTPLSADQRRALETALPPGFRVVFLENFRARWQIARLLYRSAYIRLTTPEAFEVHRSVIQWNARESKDRIPDMAVGVDWLTRKLMRWTLRSWSRVRFMNRFLAGTILPRVQLDLLPGLRCAAHFFLVAEQPPRTIDDFITAGRALQRFWLTATEQGLLAQPEMTPLIFSQYARAGLRFSKDARAIALAGQLNDQFTALLGEDTWPHVAFMGRLGVGRQPTSRSTRLSLPNLMRI